MKNFKEIAEKCLAGELSGIFILRNGDKCKSINFKKDKSILTSFRYLEDFYYSDNGYCYLFTGRKFEFDIVDFIPDNMQEQIKIDIPEGKVPVMEQTESGVVINWKDSELRYDQIYLSIYNDDKAIPSIRNNCTNSTNIKFLAKVNVLRKLINIRNYFGKPTNMSNGWSICYVSLSNKFYVDKEYCEGPFKVIFAKKEHAEQAIKMLGDELKYLFESW